MASTNEVIGKSECSLHVVYILQSVLKSEKWRIFFNSHPEPQKRKGIKRKERKNVFNDCKARIQKSELNRTWQTSNPRIQIWKKGIKVRITYFPLCTLPCAPSPILGPTKICFGSTSHLASKSNSFEHNPLPDPISYTKQDSLRHNNKKKEKVFEAQLELQREN